MASKTRCRDMLKHLSDYIDGEAAASICRLIDSHSPKCKPCKAFIATLRKSVRILNKTGRRSALSASLRRDLRNRLRDCARASDLGHGVRH
ncbi:MAG: hypothetical protein ABII00_10345 [Elusimicrobiota bacterium]